MNASLEFWRRRENILEFRWIAYVGIIKPKKRKREKERVRERDRERER